MKIGIIGSGNIGGTLGKHWAEAGHEVIFTSRNPGDLDHLKRETNDKAKVTSVEEAFEAKADVYLLAVPFKEVDKLAELYGGEYANAVIIDATNPYPDRDGDTAKEVREGNRNATEYVATRFNTAKTAKAFNTIHAVDLEKKAFQNKDYAVPYAAQDDQSKRVTDQLISDIGFEPVYVGELGETNAMEVDNTVYGKCVSGKELRGMLNLP